MTASGDIHYLRIVGGTRLRVSFIVDGAAIDLVRRRVREAQKQQQSTGDSPQALFLRRTSIYERRA